MLTFILGLTIGAAIAAGLLIPILRRSKGTSDRLARSLYYTLAARTSMGPLDEYLRETLGSGKPIRDRLRGKGKGK